MVQGSSLLALRVLGPWGFEAGASVGARLASLFMEEISAGASLRRNELPKPCAGGLGVGGFTATSCLWALRLQTAPLGRDLLSPGCLHDHLELGGGKERCRGDGEGRGSGGLIRRGRRTGKSRALAGSAEP